VLAIPRVCGAPGISRTGSRASRRRHAQDGPGVFPPRDRVDVVSLATKKPAERHGPAPRWSVADLIAARRPQPSAPAMSRSTLWRMLDDAALKPHRRVYWLTSHAPAGDTKARDLGHLYLNAFRLSQEGRVVICVDEKTGMQILPRKYPTPLAQPGQPEKREQADIRHGVRAFLASFVVPTGQVLWHLGLTRTREDCAAHRHAVVAHLPEMTRYDWGSDTLNTPWSLDVCRLVASWCGLPWTPQALECGRQRRAFLRDPPPTPVFHCTPIHGSWRNQGEVWFSVLARRCLKGGDCCSGEDFETQLCAYLAGYNTHEAPPYRWTSTGQPVVRATPCSQTCRPQRQGRAWFSPRPQRFARALYPPRPYKRKRAATQLVMNL
jgi:hypothetical protein